METLELPENDLISPDQDWILLAVLFSVAAFGFRAEKTRWGRRLSGPVIAILTTLLLSNLSIIPSSARIYGVVWSYLVPLAIPLLLFRANLKRIVQEAGPTLIAFVLGGIGTILGTVIAFHLVPLGEEGWKLAGIFCSTYIGGSVNYVAAAEALDLQSGDLLAAGVAADNLVMTLYFLVLFALPSIPLLKRMFPTRHEDQAKATEGRATTGHDEEENLTLLNMATALAVCTVVCAVGFGLADLTGITGTGILFVTALIVAAATLFPKQLESVSGADRIGAMLMQVFFATIGASADFMMVIEAGSILFVFAALILCVHLVTILVAGKVFRLDLAEIVIASNANMGGPATSAAMATARRWDGLVIPAVLCGTFGYAVATFIGVGVGYWLR